MANRRNKLVVPGADAVINRFKNEIAAELGIENYDQLDKGALPSRVNGMVGGTMTKRLIEMGQKYLAQQDPSQSNLNYDQYVQDAQQDLQSAINPQDTH
ncbi:MAG TPA: alpha/beta-type small acid-soluble spore protein [Pseudoneobacillus sp.]|nr:alpha/beta-type small acid-soluble spore protein [Pseudoneobacillus sp.]